MNEVLCLLEEKNHCLEKFMRLNEAEILSFNEGNFDNLENFYKTRESILEVIQRIDSKVEFSNANRLIGEQILNIERKAILECISYKNELVTKILSQDLQILSVIEATKSVIIKELATVRSAKKAMKGYQSGGGVNRLDEKV